MFEELKECGLLEVYSDEDDKKFDVGKLLNFDKEWLFLSCLDNYGRYGGYMLIRRENVFKINYGTRYLRDLARTAEEPPAASFSDGDLFGQFLKKVADREVVSVTLCNGNVIIGIIRSSRDGLLKIEEYADNGCEDGFAVVPEAAIVSLQFETGECLAVQKNRAVSEAAEK